MGAVSTLGGHLARIGANYDLPHRRLAGLLDVRRGDSMAEGKYFTNYREPQATKRSFRTERSTFMREFI